MQALRYEIKSEAKKMKDKDNIEKEKEKETSEVPDINEETNMPPLSKLCHCVCCCKM